MVDSEKGHSRETAQRDCGNTRKNQLASERHDVLRQHMEEADETLTSTKEISGDKNHKLYETLCGVETGS